MKKRIFSALLALFLLLAVFPVSAFAADSSFEIEGGVLVRYRGPDGDVTIPDSVTSIGEYAFADTGLTSVTIPSSVTSIGNGAFSSCTSLTSVTIPSSVTSIGGHAFHGTPWQEGQGEFPVVNGILLRYQGDASSVTIPSGVTSIGGWAFSNCTDLTSVTIPSSVTSIGEGAFAFCYSLTSVTIPNSVTSIGEVAFLYCSGLTSATIPSGVTSIGGWAFSRCSSLTSVTIPASVTMIGCEAFDLRDEETDEAYASEDLKDVYYGGTKEQWDAIDMDDENNTLKNATIHYDSPMPEAPAPTVSFTDVAAGAWYADAVAWAVEKGVTNGTSTTTFSPGNTCTQGHILTFLWRAKDEPEPEGTVTGTQYYDAAAQWAKEQGLTDDFSAGADCTRAMVVTYLWKLAGSPDVGTPDFTDVPADADYAQAVAWAVEQGITNGTSETTFSPQQTCTRGHIVTFLYRAFAN